MRVLIISAETAFCQEIRSLLESAEGITAIALQAGPRLVDQIQDLQPDLILLDLDNRISYPSDLVAAIGRRHPDIKILVLSGPGQESQALNALRNGAHGHLTTGISDRQQLVAALQAVDRGDSILSPAMAGAILDEMRQRYQLSRRIRAAGATQASALSSAPAQHVTE